jgi:hypothetical protein
MMQSFCGSPYSKSFNVEIEVHYCLECCPSFAKRGDNLGNITATLSAALICKAEFVMPAIIPEPVAGARLMTARTSVGSAHP